MTDVLLRHFDDGGDLEFINGRATTSDGLETAAYLSLWGGNELDSGIEADDPFEWWGNKSEQLPERQYRSQLQNLLTSLALIPANLRRIEDAAAADLTWFVETGPATFVQVVATIPKVNTVTIIVAIIIDDEKFQFAFTKGLTPEVTIGPVPGPLPMRGGAFVQVTATGTLQAKGALAGTAAAGASASGTLTSA